MNQPHSPPFTIQFSLPHPLPANSHIPFQFSTAYPPEPCQHRSFRLLSRRRSGFFPVGRLWGDLLSHPKKRRLFLTASEGRNSAVPSGLFDEPPKYNSSAPTILARSSAALAEFRLSETVRNAPFLKLVQQIPPQPPHRRKPALRP